MGNVPENTVLAICVYGVKRGTYWHLLNTDILCTIANTLVEMKGGKLSFQIE